jgi:hypothetical protein
MCAVCASVPPELRALSVLSWSVTVRFAIAAGALSLAAGRPWCASADGLSDCQPLVLKQRETAANARRRRRTMRPLFLLQLQPVARTEIELGFLCLRNQL